jgi:hypothetical protein
MSSNYQERTTTIPAKHQNNTQQKHVIHRIQKNHDREKCSLNKRPKNLEQPTCRHPKVKKSKKFKKLLRALLIEEEFDDVS